MQTSLASFCDNCQHKSICKIRDKIVAFDQTAKNFETDNTIFKILILNVNYSCLYKLKVPD
jgi:hypothetical protein